MKKEYEILFTPAKIGSLELKNRFVMVPMQPTALLEWTMHEKGFNPEVRDLLVNRAKDGIGLIIAGAVGPISMLNGKSLGKHPEMFEGVSELMEEIHSYGTKLFFQLTVGAGRNFPVMKGPDGKVLDIGIWQNIETKNQSADAGLPNRWVPELKTTQFTVEDIKATIESMAETAYLCKQNGVDGIDVHALHEGYLLDQFSLPYTNHRTDEYGGSLENRLRFACEIVKAIKEKCGQDYPVILRYSVTSKTRDFGKGIIPEDKDSVEIGRTLEESKKAIQILTEAGYDAFNADNGTYDAWYYAHPPVYMPLNCNLEESIAIKPFTDKPIINAGRLQLDVAADAISKGQLDFVGIARQFLVDEQYLTKIKEEREEDVIPCISCHTGCFPMGLWKDSGCKFGKLGSCALNPYTAHEKKFAVKQAENPKTVAVIGAGIAGMEFALQATKRGHKVTVYEKSDCLGGVFNEAANFTFKEKDRELLKYYETQMKKYEIDIRLNCEITDLSDIVADEIVIATGAASAKELHVEGNENTVNAIDFLANDLQCKDNVVIIGGGLTGCEIAYELAKAGKHPVVVELMNDILIAPGTCMANTGYLRDALEYYKVPVYLNSKTEKINTDSVEIITEDGNHEVLPSDTTVVSIGYTEGTSFETADDHVHIIGDANQVSNLYNAILAANELAISL